MTARMLDGAGIQLDTATDVVHVKHTFGLFLKVSRGVPTWPLVTPWHTVGSPRKSEGMRK